MSPNYRLTFGDLANVFKTWTAVEISNGEDMEPSNEGHWPPITSEDERALEDEADRRRDDAVENLNHEAAWRGK